MVDLRGEKILYLTKTRTGAEGTLESGRKIIFKFRMGSWFVGTGSTFKAAWSNLSDMGSLGIKNVEDAVEFLGLEIL